MITGSDDGSTKILDLMEGRPVFTLLGHDDAVTSVAFSANGENFATGGRDKQVRDIYFLQLVIYSIVHLLFQYFGVATIDSVIEC